MVVAESEYGHWTVKSPKPNNVVGFTYKITHLPTGHYYYGQKLLQKKIRRKPLKGKKRVRLAKAESDWKQYTGSGIVSEHAVENRNAYQFLILDWCSTKTLMDILETSYILNSVYDEKNLNQCINIRCRIRKEYPSFLN